MFIDKDKYIIWKMFCFGLFCDAKYMHKQLIKESYEEYVSLTNTFRHKFNQPENGGRFDDESAQEQKQKWAAMSSEIKMAKRIVIENIISYCKNYPLEKISANRLIIEYNKYPNRLGQSLEEIMSELEK